MTLRRLDVRLVHEGLARSRGQAQELIRRGSVMVQGRVVQRPSTPVAELSDVTVASEPDDRWVGRGARKLAGALEEWAPELAVAGRRCLDVGASTGGFTQVLLDHGAAEVVALDVGHDQLAPALVADPRVTDLPGTNIRDVIGPDQVGGRVGLVVADLSFISLTLVLPALARVLADRADVVLLVKPQFEVGRSRLGRGGVVRAEQDRADAIHAVVDAALEAGLGVLGLTASSLAGTHGNQEYLLWLAPPRPGMMSQAQTRRRITAVTRSPRQEASS